MQRSLMFMKGTKWMTEYFCLRLWRQRSLVSYLKECHYPSLMHWDYVASVMSDASCYWHRYWLCRPFVNSVQSDGNAGCKDVIQPKIHLLHHPQLTFCFVLLLNYSGSSVLCFYISSFSLSPSCCFVLLPLPTVHQITLIKLFKEFLKKHILSHVKSLCFYSQTSISNLTRSLFARQQLDSFPLPKEQ